MGSPPITDLNRYHLPFRLGTGVSARISARVREIIALAGDRSSLK